MADTTGRYQDTGTSQAWAVGLTLFAAVMMITTGIFQILQGLVGIIDDTFYVVATDYTFEIDRTTWGWIHLVAGALVTLIGVALLTGATWARVVGVVIVMFSLFSNFMFIPYFPIWSLVIIALDVAVIWALAQDTRIRG